MPQLSNMASCNRRLRSAESAFLKAQAHLEECRVQAADSTEQHQEFRQLLKSFVKPCPQVVNMLRHEFLTQIDIGGKIPINCSRYYCLACCFLFIKWQLNEKLHSVSLKNIRICLVS